MSATITVENKSGKPVNLVGCGSIYAALLVGESYHPTASWPLCAQQMTVPVGESSYPVTVSAAFNQCTAEGGAGPEPACLADGSLPPLPAGRYELMTTAVSPELPVPAPVAVTVTP
jgi:hypothetical protein